MGVWNLLGVPSLLVCRELFLRYAVGKAAIWTGDKSIVWSVSLCGAEISRDVENITVKRCSPYWKFGLMK